MKTSRWLCVVKPTTLRRPGVILELIDGIGRDLSQAIGDETAKLLRRLGIRHIRTRPYMPRTNRKAERFIQTLLREWAHAYRYPSSQHRADEMQPWMHHDTFHRPHSATANRQPPTAIEPPASASTGTTS